MKNKKKKKRNTKKWKEIIQKVVKNKEKIYIRVIEIFGIILALWGIYISLLVRQDTLELAKFSDKPIYYKIKLYPGDETVGYESEKYVNWKLNLLVDNFEIHKKNFSKVNYNSMFTHITYYMVYDYDLQNIPTYYYKFDGLDDRTQAKMRLEDKYYITASNMNYSLTPNKKYCYVLIHLKTLSEDNLDLVFFKYNKNDTNKLEFIKVDNTVQVDITNIKEEHLISKEYYTSIWSKNQQEMEDIEFMFNVYKDLRGKIKEQL